MTLFFGVSDGHWKINLEINREFYRKICVKNERPGSWQNMGVCSITNLVEAF
jgi:hypothetical protein